MRRDIRPSLVVLAAFSCSLAILGPARVEAGVGQIISIINQLFGGQINAASATSGQVLTKQSDGSWRGSTPTASTWATTLAAGNTSGGTSPTINGTDKLAFTGTGDTNGAFILGPAAGPSAPFTIQAGLGDGSTAGRLVLSGGYNSGASQGGGDAYVTATNASGGVNAGGNVRVAAGNGNGGGANGSITLATHDGSWTIDGTGQLKAGTGLSATYQIMGPTDAAFEISSPAVTNGTARTIYLLGGNSTSGTAADANVTAGQSSGGGTPGNARVTGGTGTSSTGGSAVLAGGGGTQGGTAVINGGTGSAGAGGAVQFYGGGSGGGNGNGGNVDIFAGTKNGSGVQGHITFNGGGSSVELGRFSGTNLGFQYRFSVVTEASATVGSPRTLTATESGITVINTGATSKVGLVFPAPVAGYHYYALVTDADGIRITQNASESVYLGTSSGTFVESTAIGSVIHMVSDGTNWFTAEAPSGTWSN